MDKKEALKRLETIEKEAAKLKKIVNGEKIEFDGDRNYVMIDSDGEPFFLIQADEEYFWHSLQDCQIENYGRGGGRDGQGAIDDYLYNDRTIHEFSNRVEAIEFFLTKLKEYMAK